MSRTSCISHTTSQQVVIIREDYLSICDGNHCAAALLNVFEYWMNYKLNHREQVQTENKIAAAGGAPLLKDDLWVYKTAENLKDELLGLFADTKITAALVLLKAKGFITTRNNPSYGWDRTLQYLFNTEAVQQAVNISDAYTILKNKVSKPRKQRIKALEITDENLKNKEAIPETTSKVTSETTTEIKDSAAIATVPAPVAETSNSHPVEEKESAADKAEEYINKTKPRNLTMDAVCTAFGVKPGPYAQLLCKQLTGVKDGLKGKRLEYLIDDPPMDSIEILACRDWYGTDTRYKDKGALPQTAETIYERVLEFRGQRDYLLYMQRVIDAQAKAQPVEEPPKELPPPNPEQAKKIEDILNAMARGESIHDLISA